MRGGFTILENVSFTLQKGMFATLVGPSGCGKTSLLRTLAFLDAPNEGRTLFWGQEPDARNGVLWLADGRFYPRITYVPQTLGLWPHLDIRENLLFATNRSLQVHDELKRLCGDLQLSTVLDRKPPHVSQGQRQRAALVRALLLKPEILLLDEMTAALDGRLASAVWELLHDFAEKEGTILASTHDLRLASKSHGIYHIVDCKITKEHSLK